MKKHTRRQSIKYEYNGEMLPISKIAKIVGISDKTIQARIDDGMTLEEAINKVGIKKYPVHGELLTISQASKKYNKNINTVRNRMNKYNMTLEEAVCVDLKKKYPNEIVNGETLNMMEASKKYGISYKKIRKSIHNGMTLEEAVIFNLNNTSNNVYTFDVYGKNMTITEIQNTFNYCVSSVTIRRRIRDGCNIYVAIGALPYMEHVRKNKNSNVKLCQNINDFYIVKLSFINTNNIEYYECYLNEEKMFLTEDKIKEIWFNEFKKLNKEFFDKLERGELS